MSNLLLNKKVKTIASSMTKQRDELVISLLSKYLGHEVDNFSSPELKSRLSLNVDAKGYETFCIDGVRLVCFHNSLDCYLQNKGLIHEYECKMKYEVYI